MPVVYRAMKKDADSLPTVAPSASALGVRPGIDIKIDDESNVIVNQKGMSVTPSWRDISIFRIPKRLGGQGRNNTYCFKMGEGAFHQTDLARGLELVPDSAIHGIVRPKQTTSLTQFEADLAATRSDWQIDEA